MSLTRGTALCPLARLYPLLSIGLFQEDRHGMTEKMMTGM